jgi:hypothetical protein
MIAGVRGVVRLSSAHTEDVPICRPPPRLAFPWRVWPPFSERAPVGVLPRELAKKERRPSFLESAHYAQSERTQVWPLRAFATRGDSAMLESCPFRLPADRDGITLRRCPMESNAQVPANWAFLQIPAQSRFPRISILQPRNVADGASALAKSCPFLLV